MKLDRFSSSLMVPKVPRCINNCPIHYSEYMQNSTRLNQIKWITSSLYGGIGNQLFQLVAGLATADKLKKPLEVWDLTSAISKEAFSNSTLLQWTSHEGVERLQSLRNPIMLKRMSRLVKLIEERERQFNLNRLGFFNRNSPLTYSYENFHFVTRKIRLSGYFQDLSYLKQLENSGKQFKLAAPYVSNFLKDSLIEMEQVSPIVIHIRRGDYWKFKDTIGVLHFEYFKQALKVMEASKGQEIWLFTNCNLAGTEFIDYMGIQKSKFKVFLPNSNLSEIETIYLMSKARKIIISNSTFSWWGAYLGEGIRQVIAPGQWFKDLDEPRNLIPESWKKVDSIWE